ncbi:hypothetical protein JKP88DRAFT_283958 [Tribonema minus]|uniref:MYND-type domain-containing protein n=1 Tax=Tribonema minus TaxID=303371 RepID=A0A836C6M3_9STRA|nr:hypothetical protein JKP88DRAFT_283958 [Tribonema minus]
MRGVKCAHCADGVAMPTFAPPPPPEVREVPGIKAATWRCDACGRAPEAARLAARLVDAQHMEARAQALATANGLQAQQLCGSHNAVLVAARGLHLLGTALARIHRVEGRGDIAESEAWSSASWALTYLSVAECVAAGCARRGAACAREHPPAVADMAMAYVLLEQIRTLKDPEAFVRAQSAADVRRLARYVPLLGWCWGGSDDNVLAGAALLHVPPPRRRRADLAPLRCAACKRAKRADAGASGSSGGSAGDGAAAAVGAQPAAALPLLECGGCGLVAYCSRECQKQHWRECHGAVCQTLATLSTSP